MLVSHLINDHKVDLHEGCTFNHRYVKSNPYEVENATWMLTVSTISVHVKYRHTVYLVVQKKLIPPFLSDNI
jgi:hypothetical protein